MSHTGSHPFTARIGASTIVSGLIFTVYVVVTPPILALLGSLNGLHRYAMYNLNRLAIGVAILFGRWVQKMQLTNDAVRQVLRLVVIMLWSIVLYIPLIRMMAPGAFKELMGRLEAMFRRKDGEGGGRGPQAAPALRQN